MPWAAEEQHDLPKTSTVSLARHPRYTQDLKPSSPVLCASSGVEQVPCGTGRRGHDDRAAHGVSSQCPLGTHCMGSSASPATITCLDPDKCTHWVSNTLAHTCSLTFRCCPAHWQGIWENVKFLLFWEAQWDSLSTQLDRKKPSVSEARQADPWSFVGKYFDSATD